MKGTLPRLLVASNSLRRQKLIKDLGFSFEVKILEVAESYPHDVSATAVATYLAKHKNKAYRTVYNHEIVLTADTVVIYKDKILGKPHSKNEAFNMISTLSAREHQVISGVCISSAEQEVCFSATTTVQFSALSDAEITYYINRYQPLDKAGAYGIQEWIGMVGVVAIKGCFYNVMGLPIRQVYRSLQDDFGLLPNNFY